MFFKKPKWRQFFSSFLVFALALTLLPGSAFALNIGDDIRISVVNVYVDENGNYTGVISDDNEKKLTDTFTNSTRLTENEIDTYVYSSDMPESDRSGSVVPYFFDEANRKWELYKILVANGRKIDEPGTQYELMNQEAIASANSLEDYVVNTSEISLEPYKSKPSSTSSYYFIWYGWKLAEDEPEEVTSYQVSYNLNVPSGTTTVYPVVDYGNDGLRMDIADGDGNKTQVISDLNQLNGSFYAVNPYTVSDFSSFNSGYGYADFLAFNIYNHNNYYDFVGWKANDGDELYDIGEKIDDISKLADGNNQITFTAQWKQIEPLTDEELADAAQTISLDGFISSNEVDENVLIAQSVGETMDKTGENVFLPKEEIIQYLVSAHVNSALTQVPDSGGMTFQSSFAEFTYQVSIDSKLEFANVGEDGKVTIEFDASPDALHRFAPVILKSGDETNISNATVTQNAEGVYSITFDPKDVPKQNGSYDIEIHLKWNNKNVGNTDADADMSIRGLDFKLKSDSEWTADETVKTSANIVGQFSMRDKVMQPRAYYMTASAQLTSSWEGWKDYFVKDVSGSYPVAFVHAVQFMDYELADIDLNADTSATLKANTVTATYPGTVTVTPADITIYMGGDGGYDAVVGESGTTTSNSLPHPLFKIEAPKGIAPEDLTFTNGDKTWTVVSDGNGYYHFSEGQGQDKVRVTYSYTDQSGENHTVTNDNFDPTTVGDMYATLKIDLYPGENDMTQVRAVADNGVHYVTSQSGTLTIRAVEDQDATSEIQDAAPTESVAAGSAVAVEPEGGTTYTLNDTGVELPEDSKPSLLFDSIIEDEGSTARTDALENKVDETLGAVATNATRHYEIKYLDLVDANNGNAWITSSEGTDIYWGYPEGTDQDTEFTLLHFKNLHRDGPNSGYDIDDITNISSENIEKMEVIKTANGIKFHVDAGGFSPFALVYDTVNAYTITATAGENGSISPSGEFTVTAGEDQTFTITPDRGYHIQDVLVDGVSVGAVSSYTFEAVAENHTITATFAKDADPVTRYRIEASAGEGGSISPEGIVRVSQGGSQTFTITPDQGYKIEDVLVDGESVGPVSEYTFKNVRAWHTITVTFAKLPADPGDTGVSDWLDTEHHMAYLNGYPGQVFGPDRDMTRAEAAQMFYNLLLDKDVAGTASFTDVSADAWYAEAVNTLASLGMIQGVEGNRFQPDRAITRAEFTAIAMRFTNGETTGENLFSDVNPDQWFYDVVVGAVQYGWINGYEDGTFRPESTIKRAEVAAITNRMLARSADEAYVDAHASQLRLFADVAKDHWAYYTIVEASNTHDYQTNHGNETWKDA